MTQDDQGKRYQRAAEMTLEQLEWCIKYLRTIRQNELARALARNRNTIRRRMQQAGS